MTVFRYPPSLYLNPGLTHRLILTHGGLHHPPPLRGRGLQTASRVLMERGTHWIIANISVMLGTSFKDSGDGKCCQTARPGYAKWLLTLEGGVQYWFGRRASQMQTSDPQDQRRTQMQRLAGMFFATAPRTEMHGPRTQARTCRCTPRVTGSQLTGL